VFSGPANRGFLATGIPDYIVARPGGSSSNAGIVVN
jgi:hypothetical protein